LKRTDCAIRDAHSAALYFTKPLCVLASSGFHETEKNNLGLFLLFGPALTSIVLADFYLAPVVSVRGEQRKLKEVSFVY